MSVPLSRYFHILASWAGTALAFWIEIHLDYSAKMYHGDNESGAGGSKEKLRLLNITLRTDFIPKGCEQCSKIYLLLYIFMSGQYQLLTVCELSHICKLRCEVTAAAAWRSMKMGFHFHEGISQGGVGDALLCKGTFWMLELSSVCRDHHTHPGEHSHPLVHSAASGSRSHRAGLAEKVQIWAHPGWSCQHHWEGAVCK